jgi:hypothetical protein
MVSSRTCLLRGHFAHIAGGPRRRENITLKIVGTIGDRCALKRIHPFTISLTKSFPMGIHVIF